MICSDIWHEYHSWYFKIVSNFTRRKAREITYNNFEISLVVFMPNITTNHAITYTNSLTNSTLVTSVIAFEENSCVITLSKSVRESFAFWFGEEKYLSIILKEAACPIGQRVWLVIPRSQVRVPLRPLAGFVLCRPEFKSSATLVNSHLVPSCQLRFLILLRYV